MENRLSERAFTLIELIIVVVIVAGLLILGINLGKQFRDQEPEGSKAPPPVSTDQPSSSSNGGDGSSGSTVIVTGHPPNDDTIKRSRSSKPENSTKGSVSPPDPAPVPPGEISAWLGANWWAGIAALTGIVSLIVMILRKVH